MIISVINLSGGGVSDQELQRAIRAVNRQIEEDFQPYWGFGARLRLEGKSGHKKRSLDQADMRGDAVLYVRDVARIRDAEGYHDANFAGIPYGFVFLELSRKLKEAWTITLSHEALELVADPEANLLVQGPHPKQPKRQVFHWFEMCDAVQTQWYEIDGVPVSDFVLPLYFTPNREAGSRNNFLGFTKRSQILHSFGVTPGGYVGYFNPATRKNATYSLPEDRVAAKRQKIKSEFRLGRQQRRLRAGKF